MSTSSGPVGGDARAKNLQHQRRRLAGVQSEAHEEPAVVIHEGDQVDPPVLALEHEREQVGLPELVGPGPLEEADLVGMRSGGGFLQLVAGLVQDAATAAGLAGSAGLRSKHMADAFASPVGMRLLEQQDGALGDVGEPASFLAPRGWSRKPAGPVLCEPLLPGIERMLGDAHQVAKSLAGKPLRCQQSRIRSRCWGL